MRRKTFFENVHIARFFFHSDGKRQKFLAKRIDLFVYGIELVHRLVIRSNRPVVSLLFQLDSFGYSVKPSIYHRFCFRGGVVLMNVGIYFVVTKTVAHFKPFFCGFRLTSQRLELFVLFVENIYYSGKVFARSAEFSFGVHFSRFELGNSRGFLENLAAILGFRGQKFVDSALSDNRISLSAHVSVAKDFDYIFKPARNAVEKVFAFAAPIKLTRNDYLVVLERGKKFFAVVENKRNLAIRHRFAFFRSVEYDVLHRTSAQKFCRLLAENPANRVRNVAFSAAVRSDYRGNTVSERDFVLVRERFEPV